MTQADVIQLIKNGKVLACHGTRRWLAQTDDRGLGDGYSRGKVRHVWVTRQVMHLVRQGKAVIENGNVRMIENGR